MTKLTKKLGKSSFVIAILSFVLVAVLAFGGTYAYFSASAGVTDPDDITVGTLTLDLKNKNSQSVEQLTELTIVQPGQYFVGSAAEKETYTIDLTGTNINAYVRVKVSGQLAEGAYAGNDGADSDIDTDIEFFVTEVGGTGWFLHTDGYLYRSANDGAKADVIASTKDDTDQTVELQVSLHINEKVGQTGSRHFMGKTGTWTIKAEAIQADYIALDTNSDGTVSVAELATGWAGVVTKA